MLARLQQNLPLVLFSAAMILTLSVGLRQSFGLFLTPMTTDLGFNRESFSLAMASQNLLWGIAQPFAGAIADKYGSLRVLVVGMLTYVAGLYIMGSATGIGHLQVGNGILIGFSMSATSFAIVLGAVSRLVPEEKRSMALGIVAAGGSFGQFAIPPIALGLIQFQGWSEALMSMAIMALLMAPLIVLVAGGRGRTGSGVGAKNMAGPEQTLVEALKEASQHKGFWLLTLGFFVCGFQVVFISVHLPAFITDAGFSVGLGATALALIGFFNIIGTYFCGYLGGKYSKKLLLSLLYAIRSLIILVFIAFPISEISIMIFAGSIGLLWLGTVPLTSGLVGQMFGVKYMSTLFGIVFFSHQVGSFLGVWLGGWAYDTTGSYDIIWYGSIILGLLAGFLHMPIAEGPVQRLAREQA